MPQKIVIVDYGVGNLHSVYKKLLQLKVDVFISQSPKEIGAADKIILPGIGHFGKGMQNLKALSLIDVLHEEVIVDKKPILGICLGMQLMGLGSQEAPEENGLGWLDTEVVRFHERDPQHFKVPHIGWNQLTIRKESALTQNISSSAEFYFSHSYHLADINSCIVLSETDYGYPFVSAVVQDNIFGVQFHPEKSHDQGIRIFKNFLNL
jgi:glutamine amidotransferase